MHDVSEPVTGSPPRPDAPPDLRRELAEARAALAQEQERWSTLFRLAPVPFVVSDRRGVVLEANEAAEQLFGFRPGRLARKRLATLLTGRAVEDLVAAAGEHVRRTEVTVRQRGGSGPRVEVAVRLLEPVGDHGGATVAWAFVEIEEREATREGLSPLAEELERRVAERTAELEAQRARLEAVLEGLSAGIVVADARSRRVVQANQHAEQLIGTEAHGLAIPPRDVSGFRRDGEPLASEDWPIARALLRGEWVREERVRLDRPDGSSLVLEMNAAPIRDADGRIEAAVAVFWDATERERRERTERDFVTNAAHELQTPLAAIVSAAEVLDAGAKEEPEDRDRFLAHIRRECDRLARLVHALLTLARAQTREEEPPVEELALRPLLDAIALSLTPAAGVEVRVACPAGLAVRTNRFLLEQALASLGGNAAKYTPTGSIWLRARRRGRAVEIEVADEGPGLPPGDEERLFGRFYRGGARDATGFGLGLSIVRAAVEALEGEVELRQRRPRGTAARIVLPDRESA